MDEYYFNAVIIYIRRERSTDRMIRIYRKPNRRQKTCRNGFLEEKKCHKYFKTIMNFENLQLIQLPSARIMIFRVNRSLTLRVFLHGDESHLIIKITITKIKLKEGQDVM